MPDSASVTSSTALSIVSTRSDSSAQSASASRIVARSGGASPARAFSAETRIRVMGVRRSCATLSSASRMARSSDAVFVQHAVELPRQLGEFAGGLGLGHARFHVARGDDVARGAQHLPHGGRRAVGEHRPSDQSEQERRPQRRAEGDQERPQQRRAPVRAAADLEHRAVGQERGGDHEIAAFVARDAQPRGARRQLAVAAATRARVERGGIVRRFAFDPVGGRGDEQHAARAGPSRARRTTRRPP